MATPTDAAPKKINIRTPEVMERVQAQVEAHYRSDIVEKLRARGGTFTVGNTTLRLAKDSPVNAINDALAPFGVSIDEFPATPQRIRAALRAAAETST